MRTFALFGAKNFGYFVIYGVSALTREEGKSIFRDFVRTSFMNCPLFYQQLQFCSNLVVNLVHTLAVGLVIIRAYSF